VEENKILYWKKRKENGQKGGEKGHTMDITYLQLGSYGKLLISFSKN
jgi:hypothetical protein